MTSYCWVVCSYWATHFCSLLLKRDVIHGRFHKLNVCRATLLLVLEIHSPSWFFNICLQKVSKIINQTFFYPSGQGDGVFLFAELGAFWDKTSSEAIDKAISVLMNYFEWSLKDPKSSEVEFKKLVTEIHATVETRDISNLVSYNANKWTYSSS